MKRGNTLQKGNLSLPTYNLLLIIFANLANIFAYMTIIVITCPKYAEIR
jgi:hypothetical protein